MKYNTSKDDKVRENLVEAVFNVFSKADGKDTIDPEDFAYAVYLFGSLLGEMDRTAQENVLLGLLEQNEKIDSISLN